MFGSHNTILTKAQMKAQWMAPIIIKKKWARKSDLLYKELLDDVGKYQDHITNKSLTTKIQTELMTNIKENCRLFGLERKGGLTPQKIYLSRLEKMAAKILSCETSELGVYRKSDEWYKQPWLWREAFLKSKTEWSHECFQLYEAVRIWQNQLHHNRQGAWWILTKYITPVGDVDVELEEGNLNTAAVLGEPHSTVNLSSSRFQTMISRMRRASPNIFDDAIVYLEGQMFFQTITKSKLFQALSRHVEAGVTGPFPTVAQRPQPPHWA